MKTSIRNDQRGLSPVIIVVAVAVLAAIGFAGYRMTQGDSVIKNATPAQKAVISSCEKIYKDKDLCKFSANADIEKLSYKMVLTSVDPAGKSSMLTMLSDGKGNTSLSGGSGAEAFNSVELNKVSYLKDNTDGKWLKIAASPTTDTKTDPAKDIKINDTFSAAASANFSYKKLGKEACGKLTCLKYQFIDKTQTAATQYVWFDTKDFRMQRFSSKDANGSTDMVITYQTVKIEAPTPVKELSTGASATDAAAIQAQLQALQAQAAADNSASTDTSNGQ